MPISQNAVDTIFGNEDAPENLLFCEDQTYCSQKAVAFIHIPKTAGTWFSVFLTRHFTEDIVAPPLYGNARQTDFTSEKIKLFTGHFDFYSTEPGRDRLLLMTFLRDPIQRAISQYRSFHNAENFTQVWRETASPEEIDAIEWSQSASFEEFVLSGNLMILGQLCDVQTRHLTSFPFIGHDQFLSSAIENLERHFFFFGIQELSEASVALFRHQTGSTVQWVPTAADLNVSERYDVTLSRAAQDRLHELVHNDQQLYDAAKRLFEQRISQAQIAAA